jgi:arylsulfatase
MAQKKKPNILVLWGDDIGWYNISRYNLGAMGYETPNIDRIANEGLSFTDYYGQQSCTAGRSAFLTGQNPLRTGLTKVARPGAPVGIQPEDPTIATLLRGQGYVTGHFGKHHLGDLDEFLPSNHGFDEFFGTCYAPSAEAEIEDPDYPSDSPYMQSQIPRGVIHSWMLPDGTHKVEDTGKNTVERMKTIDEEFTTHAVEFIERAVAEDKPFFVWWNAIKTHYPTHVKDEYVGRTGQGPHADSMVYHDDLVGVLLDKLDDLGIAEDTIVMYSTDNGPHFNAWPDAAITPFRSEKNTNWEGAFRVPCFYRWPGKIPAGEVRNGIVSHQDALPTLLAAVGAADIPDKLLDGYSVGDMTYRVHIDGKNMLDYFRGETDDCPRDNFFYVNDDSELVALRVDDWKIVFMEQRAKQFDVWAEPFVTLRVPKVFHLRRDPFERAEENANAYRAWWMDHLFICGLAQAVVSSMAQSLADYPPRQKPASFNLDEVLVTLEDTQGSAQR